MGAFGWSDMPLMVRMSRSMLRWLTEDCRCRRRAGGAFLEHPDDVAQVRMFSKTMVGSRVWWRMWRRIWLLVQRRGDAAATRACGCSPCGVDDDFGELAVVHASVVVADEAYDFGDLGVVAALGVHGGAVLAAPAAGGFGFVGCDAGRGGAAHAARSRGGGGGGRALVVGDVVGVVVQGAEVLVVAELGVGAALGGGASRRRVGRLVVGLVLAASAPGWWSSSTSWTRWRRAAAVAPLVGVADPLIVGDSVLSSKRLSAG